MAPEKKTEPAKTPKQLAAEARAASDAAEKRRERTIRIAGAAVVVLVVVGLLAVGFFAGRDKGNNSANPAPTADPNAATPAGVTSDTWGVKYGSGWTAADEAKLPTLELWEDFQCPGCASVEKSSGAQIQALAKDGKVKLLYRPATFLDNSLAAENTANGNPNSSARATAAWGCAIDAGKTAEYHSGIFAMQPAKEGVGYSDQQLLDLAGRVGITGADLTTFNACVANGTYLSWSANSQEAFAKSGATATPTGYLNGVQLDGNQLSDTAGLAKMIADATAP